MTSLTHAEFLMLHTAIAMLETEPGSPEAERLQAIRSKLIVMQLESEAKI